VEALYTERLVIRRWVASDADALIQIADQDHIIYWLPDWWNSSKWAVRWIDKVRKHYEIDNPMTHFISMAIVLKATNAVIGQVNAGGFEDKEIGIGYFMDRDHLDCGYTTEAMASFMADIFQRYDYSHLIATVQPPNEASIAVVKKLGFQYASTIEMLGNGQIEALPFHYYRLERPK
jgi:[ribosomal protein S5]-alanine N-acetyltransferase